MQDRVLSGMRPTGALHIGHFHGALKNWVRLQADHECFFFVADWHALTTVYDDPSIIARSTTEMVTDWLAAGLDPERATIFVQSRVIEHAELFLLLSMHTPLGWLERVPTYKDQIEKLKEKDLGTYGFLGYPLMQAADILIYRAKHVPVGEDQIPHIELTRECARRFNHLYGREPGFEEKAIEASKKLGKAGKQVLEARVKYQQDGDAEALAAAKKLVEEAKSISAADRERLLGFLEGSTKQVLVEPKALLTEASRLPGLDGQKMSKSYGNTITLREEPDAVRKKVKVMPTDPQRVRRTDAGDPDKCPVWQFHLVYSDDATKQWVQIGCRSAGIGCIECKTPVAEAIVKELEPMRERAEPYLAKPSLVRDVLDAGNARARAIASETMRDVRVAMGLGA
ncbi:tryptophan--tRNA ligase [Derxia gummosa]|uniref:Tryptophan--tRNA ligase n=1 Tax=Derxia gummosa DSM 723 TaxID=1121388 RepID=A0A9U5C6H2_9BURK|nr:tryptophan--tRNA ligase [Derxia gummosa]